MTCAGSGYRWWTAAIGGGLLAGVAALGSSWQACDAFASVPSNVAVAASPASPQALLKPNRPRIHLNTATSRELRKLPGVGELLAQRIIAARPFKSVTELARVKGMTPEQIAALRRLVEP